MRHGTDHLKHFLLRYHLNEVVLKKDLRAVEPLALVDDLLPVIQRNVGGHPEPTDNNMEVLSVVFELNIVWLEVIGPVAHLLKGRMFAFYDHHGHYDVPEAGKAILRSLDVKMQIFHDLRDAQKWLMAN